MIYHNKPTLGENEKIAVLRVLDSGWVAQGSEVKAFEDEFCAFFGLETGHAAAVSSCTAATYIVLSLLGAKNKRVAYPAYTCTAVRNAVAHSGGIECPVDSALDTPNIDIDQLNELHPNFAVIPHMYGIPVDISRVDSSIIVIEDCAQALGARIRGGYVGLQGIAGVFSFYASKIITSGGNGGMIVSYDGHLIEQVKNYRDFDQKMDSLRRFNFQMTDLQAAVGRAQLKRLPEFIRCRKSIFKEYESAGFSLLRGVDEAVPYRAILQTQYINEKLARLEQTGVQAINPLEKWELLAVDVDSVPKAARWTESTISLPIYPSLTEAQLKTVVYGVKKI